MSLLFDWKENILCKQQCKGAFLNSSAGRQEEKSSELSDVL